MQGTVVPSFIMIKKDNIQEIIDLSLRGTDIFLVELTLNNQNCIEVYIDSDQGVTIEQCMTLSRQIEGSLNRDEDDFELNVSSAGITTPFKIKRQYVKNLNKEVEVLLKNGIKKIGTLVEVTDNGFTLRTEKLVKLEGNKKKTKVTENLPVSFDDTKSTKLVFSF